MCTKFFLLINLYLLFYGWYIFFTGNVQELIPCTRSLNTINYCLNMSMAEFLYEGFHLYYAFYIWLVIYRFPFICCSFHLWEMMGTKKAWLYILFQILTTTQFRNIKMLANYYVRMCFLFPSTHTLEIIYLYFGSNSLNISCRFLYNKQFFKY